MHEAGFVADDINETPPHTIKNLSDFLSSHNKGWWSAKMTAGKKNIPVEAFKSKFSIPVHLCFLQKAEWPELGSRKLAMQWFYFIVEVDERGCALLINDETG